MDEKEELITSSQFAEELLKQAISHEDIDEIRDIGLRHGFMRDDLRRSAW